MTDKTSNTLNALFGELRAMCQRPGRPDGQALMTLLKRAYDIDATRYRDEWLSYLEHQQLPTYHAFNLEMLEALNDLLPSTAPRRLHMSGKRVGTKALLRAIYKGQVDHVTQLELAGCDLNSMVLAALSERSHIHHLHKLDVSDNQISGRGTVPLFDAEHLHTLRHLSLASTSLDSRFATAMTTSKHTQHIEVLNLCHAYINHDSLLVFAANKGPLAVTTLLLDDNSIGPRSGMALSRWHILPQLHTLSISQNAIGPHAIINILDSLDQVVNLSCRAIDLQNEGLGWLKRCAHLTRLTHLDLANNRLSDSGLQQLLESELIQRLQYLDLSRNFIRDQGAQRLTEIKNPNLHIDLYHNPCQATGVSGGVLEFPEHGP